MNFQQLLAIVKLRWQLSRNQWRKLGAINAALMMIVTGIILLASVLAFIAGLFGGYILLPDAKPEHVLIAWDVLIFGFLFFWFVGVLNDLQQSELLSIEKLLHLPVSLFGAYLLNYFSIWLSLSLAIFLPLTMGLGLAHVATQGLRMLLVFPLVFSFVLMVTAVTYQFRGWLARLMQNKRRRGTIVALMTIGIMLTLQLPALVNTTYFQTVKRQQIDERLRVQNELFRQLRDKEITNQEFNDKWNELTRPFGADGRFEGPLRETLGWVRLINMIVPIGWLPYGVECLADGRLLPALCGSVGMLAITIVSLRRSYRGAMKLCLGENTSVRTVADNALPSAKSKPESPLIERTIPGVSELVSTIALSSLMSLLRSSQGKIMLMTPIFFLCMAAAFLMTGSSHQLPTPLMPGVGIMAILMALISIVPFVLNVFGFDQSGFRMYILMPVPRHDLLKAKNLSLFPLYLMINGLMICLQAFLMPLHFSHGLATIVQIVISYFLLVMIGNLVSIQTPMPIPTGSNRPRAVRIGPMLIYMLITMIVPFVCTLPGVIALGLELVLEHLAGIRVVPLYLVLSIVELFLVVLVYSHVVVEQGNLLQQRETRILEVVAAAGD